MLIQTKIGRRQRVNDKVGRALIQRGLATDVQDIAEPAPRAGYQTRMMQAGGAADLPPAGDAPYGYKADGTPRKRPAPSAANKKTR